MLLRALLLSIIENALNVTEDQPIGRVDTRGTARGLDQQSL
ncbi:MAG: hypothetical protein WBH35_01030 [Bacillota bacterium]|nr:hypothetical protein [Bacillota bacterium]HPZ54310.1 hypothetical protein [Bacillota bacterium]HQD17593.1 hypothetical protein [Bacillota bacterium]